jgi:catecholate siderophore receptor
MRLSRRRARQGLAMSLLAAGLVLGPLAPAAGAAQNPAASATLKVLRGRVLDPSGAPIAGATVAIADAAAGAPRSVVTDARGLFAADVAPGTYVLTIEAPGFDSASRRVTTGTAGALDVTLRVSGVSETVVVDAAAVYRTPVTASATRTPTPLRDVPQSVSVISSALIADQRMTSMADVVRYMPGVGIAQGEGNRDTPILRGNSSTADFFVDGIRDDVQYFRDVYNVDRVEALKGPNAMMFGRGGAGGVINRVTRRAEWMDTREVSLQVGSFDNRRLTADLGRGFSEAVAVRAAVMYENSDSYRDGVSVERYGINPTIGLRLGAATTLHAGYEHFRDERTADRGIPSYDGRPVDVDASTFFGDPDQSLADAEVHLLSGVLEHTFAGGATLRNRVGYGDYDKFYQNVFPGAVDATNTSVAISGYNNATTRRNLFNQTDLVVSRQTGRIGHRLLIGTELGRQVNDGFRQTGYFSAFGPSVTSIQTPLTSPTISTPMAFRQSATDADNHGVSTVAAVYAQDQVALSEHVQAVVGLRVDRFEVEFTNNRTGAAFTSTDVLVSPRLGLIYKPIVPVSIYGSYSLSYLPRAGEQLTSLSLSNQALEPEEFRNYEVGLKWDVVPAFAVTAAVYRLNRGNVVVPDPDDPTASILVDGQRTEGLELEVSGSPVRRWSVAGGYAYQDGTILQSLSASAQAGARPAQLPAHSVSLWNKVELTDRVGAALGIVRRSDVFTSTDNTVVLPAYTRLDAGVFVDLTGALRAQVNMENLLDTRYYLNAHSNTNITPGSPRAVRVSLTARF